MPLMRTEAVKDLLKSGVQQLFSTTGAFAAVKKDGSVVLVTRSNYTYGSDYAAFCSMNMSGEVIRKMIGFSASWELMVSPELGPSDLSPGTRWQLALLIVFGNLSAETCLWKFFLGDWVCWAQAAGVRAWCHWPVRRAGVLQGSS